MQDFFHACLQHVICHFGTRRSLSFIYGPNSRALPLLTISDSHGAEEPLNQVLCFFYSIYLLFFSHNGSLYRRPLPAVHYYCSQTKYMYSFLYQIWKLSAMLWWNTSTRDSNISVVRDMDSSFRWVQHTVHVSVKQHKVWASTSLEYALLLKKHADSTIINRTLYKYRVWPVACSCDMLISHVWPSHIIKVKGHQTCV